MKIEFSTEVRMVDVPEMKPSFDAGEDTALDVDVEMVPCLRLGFTCNIPTEKEREKVVDAVCLQSGRPIEIAHLSMGMLRIDIDIYDCEFDDPNVEHEFTTLICEKIVDVLGPQTRLSRIIFMPL